MGFIRFHNNNNNRLFIKIKISSPARFFSHLDLDKTKQKHQLRTRNFVFVFELPEYWKVFDEMQTRDVVSACSHAGLLDQGKRFFKLMTNEYKIVPWIEHFACMVDLLGRSRRINEAYEFINKMKMEPNDRIWILCFVVKYLCESGQMERRDDNSVNHESQLSEKGAWS
ncbi:putative tetratricopeptide-like helical domain superfamily [Helianthus annuus]|uniref:Tetratricopeptide-like helical domain superfamily n=1 Tax=Helianthus annuus TaxID=4232 RepID=A0A9K3DYP2_HELAN|nr:putative tetratricopeptide-like helical domain superfamily [Helianthus annuus]KAJ0449792.1 putative tetratricopeptide-like helical domain superfamily [Helianthus annuus]KAJ0471465.1 putative tetratricopeptide-like helical domain superfamily [Helianthus annuus]KAJ0650989.1 putative tetratricopeptide-like helical domain superfamily [Helianthus annuus]KAJ0829563.1 putative tetratricopeptide-like helical domain superfamily [Helianthus annuus]